VLIPERKGKYKNIIIMKTQNIFLGFITLILVAIFVVLVVIESNSKLPKGVGEKIVVQSDDKNVVEMAVITIDSLKGEYEKKEAEINSWPVKTSSQKIERDYLLRLCTRNIKLCEAEKEELSSPMLTVERVKWIVEFEKCGSDTLDAQIKKSQAIYNNL